MNESGMQQEKSLSKVRQPDFQNLLENLRSEINQSVELSNRFYYLGNQIKTIDASKEGEDPSKEKEPVGVLEYLWVEIYKLRKSNKQLFTAVEHLSGMIGT